MLKKSISKSFPVQRSTDYFLVSKRYEDIYNNGFTCSDSLTSLNKIFSVSIIYVYGLVVLHCSSLAGLPGYNLQPLLVRAVANVLAMEHVEET